jgi:hypothetical protein
MKLRKHLLDSTSSLQPLAFAGLCLLAIACGASQDETSTPAVNQGNAGNTGVGGSAGQQGSSGATSVAGQAQGGIGNTAGTVGASGSNGTGGTAPTAGSGGVATGGTAGAGGAATGGAAGTGGTAGAAGSPGGDGMDTPPTHVLAVDPNVACNCTIEFSATDLDPMAGTSPTPTHAGDTQKGRLNPTKPIKGKLVMTLGGIGGGPGQGGINGYAENLGFHTLQIAYQTNESSAPDDPYKNTPEAERTDEDNRQMGDARMEAFDGVDRVDWLDINRSDSFERRTELALVHMQEQDPGGDWAYFLTAEGKVRWSDVWLVGYSYGSQTLAVWGKYIRIGRGIATSGPADEGFPSALWITENPGATPLDRMYMLVGSSDVGNKVDTVLAAGWLGPSTDVSAGVSADFFATNPHVFVLQGQGHGEFCAGDGGQFKNLCDYAFGSLQP